MVSYACTEGKKPKPSNVFLEVGIINLTGKKTEMRQILGPTEILGFLTLVYFSHCFISEAQGTLCFKGQLEKQKHMVPTIEVARTDQMPSVPVPGRCQVEDGARGTTAKVPV